MVVVGLGLLVAASTVLQAMQVAGAQDAWRPFVLIGAVIAGVIAAWQAAVTIMLARGERERFDPAALTADDPKRVGPYRLVARLGAGAMGRAYLARDRDGGLVAVKVVRGELAENREFRRRFEREVKAIGSVRSPFTSRLIAADPQAARPWLATPFVAGPSLQQAVDEHGAWPADRLWELAHGVAQALAAIHAAGVVHRDLKPGNVLLDADGPRVIDFGISRAVDASTLTVTTHHPGTPAFMSPEQVMGGRRNPVGPASDVFAFGLLIAFAATGEPPYGEGTGEVLLQRIRNEPPDLSGVPDAELRALLEECVRRDPAQRPAAEQIVARCREHVRQREPEELPAWLPAPVGEEIGRAPTVVKPGRSRRLALVTAVVALLIALASIGIQFIPRTPAPAQTMPIVPSTQTSASASAGAPAEPSASPQASPTPSPAPSLPAPQQTTRQPAPPPPPPTTQGPPCIVGLWTLSSSLEYVSIDNTPPDELRHTAGTKRISYGVNGSGTMSYQDMSRFATASDDGTRWHYLHITASAEFDYGISNGKLNHTLRNLTGQMRIFEGSQQIYDGKPSDPFYAGAQEVTCTATTLTVTAQAFRETYRRT